jgi:hypothetical protein
MSLSNSITSRDEYTSNGFYLNPDSIFPDDVVQAAVDGMDEVREGNYDTGETPELSPWNPGDDPNTLCKIEMPQKANRAIQNLLKHSSLGKLAAEITGADMVQIWWVQLLYKPSTSPEAAAQSPTRVGWHQDFQYWNDWEECSELFTAWIALSDVTEDSGPVKFVQGSHQWGFLNEGDFFSQGGEELDKGLVVPAGKEWQEVNGILKPGGVSFHHCLTYHGSGVNVSGSPRRSFAVHLRTEKSRCLNPNGHLTKFMDDHEICPIIFKR